MKIIKYKFLSHEINHGTEEAPDMEPVYIDKTRECSDSTFESELATAKAEAYNGEVTVEEVADPDVPETPSDESSIWTELNRAYQEGVDSV